MGDNKITKSARTNGVNANDGIEQIREIIAGRFAQELQRELEKVKKLNQQQLETRTERTDSRMDSLESYLNQEIQSMSKKLSQLSNLVTERLQTVTSDLEKIQATYNSKMREVDERMNQLHDEQRRFIRDQVKSIENQSKRARKETEDNFRAEIEELSVTKASRSQLSVALREIAHSIETNTASGLGDDSEQNSN